MIKYTLTVWNAPMGSDASMRRELPYFPSLMHLPEDWQRVHIKRTINDTTTPEMANPLYPDDRDEDDPPTVFIGKEEPSPSTSTHTDCIANTVMWLSEACEKEIIDNETFVQIVKKLTIGV